ncbi:MAG: sugar phosphate nucleotidyltransferase [Nanoarchaeota archaeon]
MKAIILAGGFGTRLRPVVSDVPKPMASIAGKPFLEHQIRFLKENGIREIIIAVHHMANKIKSYFGNGQRWGVDITYSEEEIPLGTGGAIKKAERYIDNSFLVLNGDTYSNLNLHEFIDFHKSKRSKASIAITKSSDGGNYGVISINEGKIVDFMEKKGEGEALVNSGVYLFEPEIFSYIEPEKNVSLEREIFPKLLKEKLLWGYEHEGYFIDIGRPETYFQFKQNFLDSITLKESDSVREAIKRISKNGVDLILVSDEKKKLLGVFNDRLMKEYMLKGGNFDDDLNKAMVRDPQVASINDKEDKISEILRAGLRHLPIVDDNGIIKDVEFYVEKVKPELFPVIRGKSPLRIGFAGGGTDLPNFFEKHGGVVINAAINKYCHGTIIKRADSKIHIDSDLGEELIANSINDLAYDGKFDLIKAAIKVMNPDFGFELYLHNDLLPGTGLGSSASLSVLLVSLISYLQGIQYDDYKVAELAYKAEREELKIKGGWQDQYAAVSGGFNFIEFNKEKTIIYPLKLKEEVINELNNHLLLCFVGKSRFSDDQHRAQEERFLNNEADIVNIQNEHKQIAIEIKDSLLRNELENVGRLLNASWHNKKRLSPIISNSNIDGIYEAGLKNGAYGGRLLGSGGGGYLLFFYSPIKRNQLTRALKNSGGEILNFNFESNGARVWDSKNRA